MELDSEEVISIGKGVRVTTARNNHPGGGLSYRIDWEGRSCCYVTDTEHGPEIDSHLKELCTAADVVIYDSTFTDEEYHGINETRRSIPPSGKALSWLRRHKPVNLFCSTTPWKGPTSNCRRLNARPGTYILNA